MDDKPEDFAPPIDEVNELFFGNDDREEVDLSRGRPKKEVNDGNTEPKRKRKRKPLTKAQKATDALIKQANFLKKFEEKLLRRDAAEQKQKKERAEKKENKKRIRAKQEARRFQPTLGKHRYASIGGDHCVHDDKIRHMLGGRITTCCKKCSRVQEWSMAEWSAYVVKRQETVTEIENPDISVFPM